MGGRGDWGAIFGLESIGERMRKGTVRGLAESGKLLADMI